MSGFLLDTNVISELVKPNLSPPLLGGSIAPMKTFSASASSLCGEIRKGIASLPEASSRRVSLETWLDHELALRFAGRILAFDQAVADRGAELRRKRWPRSPAARD